MKAEPKSEQPISNGDHASLPTKDVEKFNEIEDRLAQSLTSNEIQACSTNLISQIREAISSQPPDLDTAKFLALELKQLNRLSNFRNHRLKSEVQALQNNADLVYLSFNNLANEISHIRKSITTCLDFRSSDLDLELVPIDHFLTEGAKEIGFDLAQKDDEHSVRIGRLNFELAQRNSMCDQLREREDLKSLLNSDIKGKINRLGQIKPLIGSIRDAAKPLLDILNLKKVSEATPESRRRAQMLPKELKLMHLYCGVYNELYPDETLIFGCEGELQAVEKFEKRQKSSTPEIEEEQERMEVDDEEPINEEDEASKPKRRRISPSKEKQDAQQLRERILQFHPIALTLAIPCEDLLASLHLYYLPDLKCITVKSSVTGKINHNDLFSTDNLFNDLLGNDSGEECPNEIGAALLKVADVNLGDHLMTIGKPYRFAQLIGNSNEDSSESQFENFKCFVNAIRQRVTERQNLSKTLQQLESTNFEQSFPSFIKKLEPKETVRMLNVKIDFNPTTNNIQPEQENQWQSEFAEELNKNDRLTKGFHFQCNVKCGSITLSVLAFIPHSYPRTSSTIILNLRQPLASQNLIDALKDFEKALNIQVPAKALNEKSSVLSAQIATIIRRLPIVFKLDSDSTIKQEENTEKLSIEDLLFD